nr:MAG TPA: hypothetical protein [Caudoviricetes sp.]
MRISFLYVFNRSRAVITIIRKGRRKARKEQKNEYKTDFI